MAPPRLEEHKLATILDCLRAGWSTEATADAAGCSKPSVRRIRRNLRIWGEPYAPVGVGGQQKALTTHEEDVRDTNARNLRG